MDYEAEGTEAEASAIEAERQEAWRRYAPGLARIRRDWAMTAEPAHVFDPRPFAPPASARRRGP